MLGSLERPRANKPLPALTVHVTLAQGNLWRGPCRRNPALILLPGFPKRQGLSMVQSAHWSRVCQQHCRFERWSPKLFHVEQHLVDLSCILVKKLLKRVEKLISTPKNKFVNHDRNSHAVWYPIGNWQQPEIWVFKGLR